jgi:hypothetical protein
LPQIDFLNFGLLEAVTWFYANLLYFEDKKEANLVEKNSKIENIEKIWDFTMKMVDVTA